MPKPRKLLISLAATPYYHCVSRCVRRTYLCGFDHHTNTDYEHRRQWIEDRIHFLAKHFAVDMAAFAIMHNHQHLVLHINKVKSLNWSDKEVCQRWHQIYKGTVLTQKYLKDETLTEAELTAVKIRLDLWRERLCSISWFMRALNEPIARQANAEDKCTGSFWESRFKSQALLDEKALMACLAYVDLNPVRAKMAETPETSEHTSIKLRCETLKEKDTPEQPTTLMPFVGNPREPMPAGLPFHLEDYIKLVDWSGRIIREGKRGSICNELPPIIDRLDIEPETWINLVTTFESRFKGLVGEKDKVRRAAQIMGFKRTPGLANCTALLH